MQGFSVLEKTASIIVRMGASSSWCENSLYPFIHADFSAKRNLKCKKISVFVRYLVFRKWRMSVKMALSLC